MPSPLQYANMNNADVISFLYPEVINFSSAGDNVIIPAVAGQRILIYRLFFIVSDITNLTFKDGLNINLTGALPMAPYGAWALDISNLPWFQTTTGKSFIINSSQPVQVSGAVYYQQS